LLLFGGIPGCAEPLPRHASPRVEQGRESWACGFPSAATDAAVEDATVMLRVLVKKNGAPAQVQIVAATSPLFIEHTRQCALAHYNEVAYDMNNRRGEGWTAPFKIHYLADSSAALH
jgi:hypothetical protein